MELMLLELRSRSQELVKRIEMLTQSLGQPAQDDDSEQPSDRADEESMPN